jgi:hypothetical protein
MRACAWPGCQRGDVGDGSKAAVWRCPRYFRFTPENPTFIVRTGMSQTCQHVMPSNLAMTSDVTFIGTSSYRGQFA